jgi:hypothetical protein
MRLLSLIFLTSGLLACSSSPSSVTGGGSITLTPCATASGVVATAVGTCPTVGPTSAPTVAQTSPTPAATAMSSGGGTTGLPMGIIIDTTTSGPVPNVQVFATTQGQSLYYFSKDYDTAATYFDGSRCPFNGANPSCAADWPPVMAVANDPAVTFEANAPFPQTDAAQIMGWTSFARNAASLGGVDPGNQLAYNGHAVYTFTDAAGACNKLPADPLQGSSGDGVSCDPGDFTWHLLTTATGTTGP